MFSISTKSDYGFIVMLELVHNYGQGLLSLSDIANRRQLSSGYLAQILQPLLKAKLVISKEGKGGGYKLARSPKEISVLEIIEALEGKMDLVKCLKHGKECCAGFAACDAKKVWGIIAKDVQVTLENKTLAGLVRKI